MPKSKVSVEENMSIQATEEVTSAKAKATKTTAKPKAAKTTAKSKATKTTAKSKATKTTTKSKATKAMKDEEVKEEINQEIAEVKEEAKEVKKKTTKAKGTSKAKKLESKEDAAKEKDENSEEKPKKKRGSKKNLKLDVVESQEEPNQTSNELEEIPKAEELVIPVEKVEPKSGRGRKLKSKDKDENLESEAPQPAKKRGRKPKPKTETPPTNSKRKGKNPKESYGLVENMEEEEDPFFQNMTEETKECQETPILKLNITARDIQKIKDPNTNLMEGDSDLNIPHAFIPATDTYSYFQAGNTTGSIANMIKQEQKMTEKDIQDFKLNREKELEESTGDSGASKLLCQFIEHNRKGSWPTKSNYDCMWDRNPFETVPWPIPIKLKDNGKFEVFGNFCSPGCAAAFIFDQFHDDEIWDRYALLNVLYQKVYDTTSTVKVAPSTLFLKKLGGILTIEEFREISENPNKNYFVKMPPMVSIIPSVEEIQQTSLFNDRGSHNQLNKELMMKASNELRLKRSKPIYDKNNTLDNYFHIGSSEMQN